MDSTERLDLYWHGGHAGIQGKLLPPDVTGAAPTTEVLAGSGIDTDHIRSDVVYVTRDYARAVWFAAGFEQPAVYAVWPDGPVEDDPDSDERGTSFQCESATIVKSEPPQPELLRHARETLMAMAATIDAGALGREEYAVNALLPEGSNPSPEMREELARMMFPDPLAGPVLEPLEDPPQPPPGAYWHGGPAGLKKILPRSLTRAPGPAHGRTDRVYLTEDYDVALNFALQWPEPMVYAVLPDNEVEFDGAGFDATADGPSLEQLAVSPALNMWLCTTSATVLFAEPPDLRRVPIVRTAAMLAREKRRREEIDQDGWSSLPASTESDAPCDLCRAAPTTPRLHEDPICWIALCSTCDVPMVVWKRHRVDPGADDLRHMIRQLTRVAEGFFGSAWGVDDAMRSIPDHWHAHARHIRVREHTADDLPLKVCSLEEASAIAASDHPPRAVVSIVNSVAAVPFRHEVHLLRECRDRFLPGVPGVAGADEAAAVAAFAREIGPEPGVLVHCNLGVSRSTAAALIMLTEWGWDAQDAYEALVQAHPPGRPFMPNQLMVEAAFDALRIRV